MTLSFTVNKPANFVFDYLTDMQKFVSIHPVISKMNDLGNNNYKVYETLKFVSIPISFTYPASVNGHAVSKTVFINATVMKLAKIEMCFNISEKNGVSSVEEVIVFKTMFPVKAIMRKIFRTQHSQLFKNMEALV